ncbi:MAG: M48 family metalloprotease [Alphaproteobacteria bacterium]|nr:M48 family metalloprotease [Alphaproteobacteria bacterium]
MGNLRSVLIALGLVAILTSCVTDDGSEGGGLDSAMRSVSDGVAGLFGDTADPSINALVLAQSYIQDVDVDEVENVEALTDPNHVCDPTKKRPEADFKLGIEDIRETGYGTWPIKNAEKYLNQILDRIIACAPFDPVPATIVIAPQPQQNAHVHRDGLIEVSVESFTQNPQNENALAFMIAHEYSHILLRHYERGLATERRNKIFRTSMEVAFLADDILVSNGAEKKAADKMKSPMLVNRTMDVLFEHAWGRQDEHEADMLGLHLAALAGFNASIGAGQFFKDMERQPTMEDRVLALAEDKERIFGDAAKGGLTGGKKGILDVFKQAGQDAAQSLAVSLQDSHPSVEARQEILFKYDLAHGIEDLEYDRIDMGVGKQFPLADYKKVYSDAELQLSLKAFAAAKEVHDALGSVASLDELPDDISVSALESKARLGVSGRPWLENNAFGRVAFSSLREMQGKNDLAIVGFEKYAMKDPEVPLRVYENLFDRQLQAKKVKEAIKTFSKAEATFGSDNDILYPMRIKLAHAKGEDPTSLLAGCRLSADPRIARICRFWQQGGVPQS